jgi:hypothetical protein
MHRMLLYAIAAIIGCYGLISAAAEGTTSRRPDFPTVESDFQLASRTTTQWLGAISPIRSDLESNETLRLALEAIRQNSADRPNQTRVTLIRLRQVLCVRPYDAELWLALAVLEARRDPDGPGTIETLKMSYLAAPSERRLMPLRLRTATRFNALVDSDLRELARSDVRLMLTRRPNQESAFVSIYERASERGKAFLRETAQVVAPSALKAVR